MKEELMLNLFVLANHKYCLTFTFLPV
uniref:Uncharacterized protein n=1 Tax=Rhizophora mucronata TaxID=61149 RepID=A0A2P2QP83_RHIMU